MKYLLISVLLLTGCSSTFTHPTKSDRDLSRDEVKCRSIASNIGDDWLMTRHYFNKCMYGEGYNRE